MQCGDPFHDLAYLPAGPCAVLIGWSPCQQLADFLITDLRPTVLFAKPPDFGHPNEQRLGINFAISRCAGDALDAL